MKNRIIGFGLLSLLLLTSFKTADHNKQVVLMGFAVVELFTSEGCSSCPPADQTLMQLSKEFATKPVYFLSFHVDYWDNKSWKDPYSDHDYTDRQRHYTQLFHAETYTPQAVFNGKQELIGSEGDKLRALIKASLKVWPSNSISFGATIANNQLNIKYDLHSVTDDDLVNVALVQERATDKITGGENNGATISHVNVVRAFKTVSAKLSGTAQLTIPSDMAGKAFRIITYIQSKSTWNVTAGNTIVISPSRIITVSKSK
ncbi:DUF1223 domain-containing protein [Mucilaginibacter agri]|uniref:DUF1223 domain-containing protein n=1 Tax=Mucilaginibacter agri TaxID=2695265 RepID=A0A965ZFL7_9SPHI|nr:DUF1223 domain-containing protein [Mucilaginibacter agri]NCD68897.1 DUF1223 domain-containing protein [Mucilaginibacter agri]